MVIQRRKRNILPNCCQHKYYLLFTITDLLSNLRKVTRYIKQLRSLGTVLNDFISIKSDNIWKTCDMVMSLIYSKRSWLTRNAQCYVTHPIPLVPCLFFYFVSLWKCLWNWLAKKTPSSVISNSDLMNQCHMIEIAMNQAYFILKVSGLCKEHFPLAKLCKIKISETTSYRITEVFSWKKIDISF